MLCSNCLSWMLSPKHNCYLSYNRCPRSSCHSWPCCQSIKLYKNHTYTSHAAIGYRIKLQHQEYSEWCTTENNNMKIAIELTSVGLAHAHSNYCMEFCVYMLVQYIHHQYLCLRYNARLLYCHDIDILALHTYNWESGPWGYSIALHLFCVLTLDFVINYK